jgi:hypothetical protein
MTEDLERQVKALEERIDQLLREGKPRAAIAPAEAVCELLRHSPEEPASRLVAALRRLGQIHEAAGDLAGAELVYRQLVEMCRSIPGAEADLRTTLTDLARVRRAQGHVDAARAAPAVPPPPVARDEAPGRRAPAKRELPATRAAVPPPAAAVPAAAPAPARPAPGAAGAAAPPAAETGQRQATVRGQVRDLIHEGVKQEVSEGFRVSASLPVIVEPILPGCTCYPPRREVSVEDDTAQADFDVAAQVEGKLERARVLLTQHGRVLAEVPLQVRVGRTTLAWTLGLLSAVVPYVQKYFKLDVESQMHEGFELYFKIVGAVLALPWWAVSGGLLLAAAAIAIVRWPRQGMSPSVFCKAEIVTPAQQLQEIERLVAGGEAQRGQEQLEGLLRSRPEFQPAWLLAAARAHCERRHADALAHYEKAFALGPAAPSDYFQAARSAARLEQHDRAVELLRTGLQRGPDFGLRQRMLFNLGCYCARTGAADAAVRHLEEAVAAGLTDAGPYREDPDLASLRDRADFQKLLARLRK